MRDVRGATINAMGISVTVDKVLYAHHETVGWDIEFIDACNHYRHWKQWDDGGEIIFPTKRLINSQGTDCTDLFRKYGYKV